MKIRLLGICISCLGMSREMIYTCFWQCCWVSGRKGPVFSHQPTCWGQAEEREPASGRSRDIDAAGPEPHMGLWVFQYSCSEKTANMSIEMYPPAQLRQFCKPSNTPSVCPVRCDTRGHCHEVRQVLHGVLTGMGTFVMLRGHLQSLIPEERGCPSLGIRRATKQSMEHMLFKHLSATILRSLDFEAL